MIYIVLNAGAILLATLAGLAFGAVWQSNPAFRRPASSGAPVTLCVAFVAQVWLCAILAGALILAPPKGGVWTMTLGSAFVIWLGFVAPTLIASYRYRAIPLRSALWDCTLWLGTMLVQAVVLRLVGLMPPPG
jgi:hypothetical protein